MTPCTHEQVSLTHTTTQLEGFNTHALKLQANCTTCGVPLIFGGPIIQLGEELGIEPKASPTGLALFVPLRGVTAHQASGGARVRSRGGLYAYHLALAACIVDLWPVPITNAELEMALEGCVETDGEISSFTPPGPGSLWYREASADLFRGLRVAGFDEEDEITSFGPYKSVLAASRVEEIAEYVRGWNVEYLEAGE